MSSVARTVGQAAGLVATVSAIALGPFNPVTIAASPPSRDFAAKVIK